MYKRQDYIYVGDVSEMLIHSLEVPLDKSYTYNLSSGEVSSLNQILALIRQVTGENFVIKRNESLKSDNAVVRLDNQKILKAMPSIQITSLREGIKKTWEHYQNIIDSEE